MIGGVPGAVERGGRERVGTLAIIHIWRNGGLRRDLDMESNLRETAKTDNFIQLFYLGNEGGMRPCLRKCGTRGLTMNRRVIIPGLEE